MLMLGMVHMAVDMAMVLVAMDMVMAMVMEDMDLVMDMEDIGVEDMDTMERDLLMQSLQLTQLLRLILKLGILPMAMAMDMDWEAMDMVMDLAMEDMDMVTDMEAMEDMEDTMDNNSAYTTLT